MEAGARTGYSGTGNTYRQAAVCQLRKAISPKKKKKKPTKGQNENVRDTHLRQCESTTAGAKV